MRQNFIFIILILLSLKISSQEVQKDTERGNIKFSKGLATLTPSEFKAFQDGLPNLKNNLGVLAYYLKGIEELPKMKPINVKVSSKEINYNDEIYFMLIMNGKSAGGFKKIAPAASINDGLLDVFIFKKCALYELIPLMLNVVNGEHMNNPHVIYFQTDELTVECDRDIGTDLDGEKGSTFPLVIKTIPKTLKINTKSNNEIL